jgi:hypothetical protein
MLVQEIDILWPPTPGNVLPGRTMGPWGTDWVVGRLGAHHSDAVTERNSAAVKRMASAWIGGCWWRRLAHGWTAELCGACSTLGSIRERQETAVDGELCEEEESTGDLGSPALIIGASRCKQTLADEEVMAVRTLGMNVNGVQQSVVAPVSRGDGGGESEQSGKRAQVGKKVEGSPLLPCTWGLGRHDMGFMMTSGDRHRCPICREHGHRLVTGPVAGVGRTG